MAIRGRKPNPTALNRLRGNPGHRGANHGEPKMPARAPSCPKHLDAVAKKEWRRVAKLLVAAGMIAEADRAALAGYCRAWSLFVEADEHVQRYGSVCVSEKTGAIYQSPYVNQMTAAAKDMLRFAAELGMTPSARTRLKVSADREPEDPLMDMIARRYDGT